MVDHGSYHHIVVQFVSQLGSPEGLERLGEALLDLGIELMDIAIVPVSKVSLSSSLLLHTLSYCDHIPETRPFILPHHIHYMVLGADIGACTPGEGGHEGEHQRRVHAAKAQGKEWPGAVKFWSHVGVSKGAPSQTGCFHKGTAPTSFCCSNRQVTDSICCVWSGPGSIRSCAVRRRVYKN